VALTAIVLAGGQRDGVCAGDPNAPNKAFVAINGRSLVARTMDALRSAESIGRIIAVAPHSAHGRPELAQADEVRAGGARMADSLRAGIAGLPAEEQAIVAASDLPVLTAAAVDEFAGLVRERAADVTYACVARAVHEAAFPGVPHTWATMAEGQFCGGGLAALRPLRLASLERFLDRLGSARKNPLQLAAIFGAEVMFRYATGSLSIAACERRASELLGGSAAAAVCSHAEIAFNVDRPGDVALAERYARTSV
jgi:molybdopterin-guanine dinucleotide biosynthesis protein A